MNKFFKNLKCPVLGHFEGNFFSPRNRALSKCPHAKTIKKIHRVIPEKNTSQIDARTKR